MERDNSVETKEEFPSTHADRRLIGLLPMFILVLIIVLRISWTLYKSFGQKTRSPQQRRMYVGTRARPSLSPHEPTIYVSPSNLPPPPKYECMAPPSYEEVVGVHYPNYQTQQPITQPITTALAHAQTSTTEQANDTLPNDTRPNDTRPNDTRPNDQSVVVTINERQIATSS